MDTGGWLGRNLCVLLEFDHLLAFVQRGLSRCMFRAAYLGDPLLRACHGRRAVMGGSKARLLSASMREDYVKDDTLGGGLTVITYKRCEHLVKSMVVNAVCNSRHSWKLRNRPFGPLLILPHAKVQLCEQAPISCLYLKQKFTYLKSPFKCLALQITDRW
jgi:hypothetical protein